MKSFFNRAFWLMVADAGSKGAGAILALILARVFGPAEFGAYAAATSVAAVYVLATYIGFEQEMVRRSASSPLGESLALTIAWSTVLAAAAAWALAAQVSFFPNPLIPGSLLGLAFAAQIAGRFFLPYRYAGIVLGETRPAAIIQAVSTFLLISGTLIALMIHRAVQTALVAQFLVALATVGVWEAWRRRRHIPFLPAGRKTALTFFGRSLAFALTNALWVLYFNLAVVLMAWISGAADVGVYSAVFRLVAITFVATSAVSSAYSPSLFAAAKEGPAAHRAMSVTLMKSIALVSLGTAAGLALFARPLIRLVMGDAYLSGVPAARILAAAAFLRGLNFAFSEIITTGERHRWRVGLEAALVASNVGFSLLWIPVLGPLGGALAALAAEGVMTAGGFAMWRRLNRESAATTRAFEARDRRLGTPA